MEYYYHIIFMFLFFLQEELEGYFATVICLVMTFTTDYLIKYLNVEGFTYFESAALTEGVLLLFAAIILHHKLGKILALGATISFLSNILFVVGVFRVGDQYDQYFYKGFNLILFEVLIWFCFINTTIYPRMKILVKSRGVE